MNMLKTYSIADCSKKTDFSQRQLRNYEARGYIDPPQRITCGEIRYRRYSDADIESLKIFKTYLDQGFTLSFAAAKTAAHQAKGVE